jgi:hypothetical protein
MGRLMPIVAFAVLLALPLWAQHGGGHAVGGHGGGFAGHGGFRSSGGVHVSGAMHSAPSRGFTRAPSFSQRSFSHRPFLHDGFRGPRERRFRSDCRGFDCRAWGWGGYYDPFWWGDSSSSYDEDYERDRAVANEMNVQSLEEQRMRQQEQGSDQDSYNDGQNRYTRSAPGSRDPAGASVVAPTVLIFRDQHKLEIQNYAIVGQTLWIFSPLRAEKIPLSNLDLTATTKANDERGLSFKIPASNEAQ